MIEQFSPLALVWAFTYLIHSSVLITLAFMLDRAGLIKKTRNAELVWRFALFGALLTTTVQLWMTSSTDAHTKPAQASLISSTNKTQNTHTISPLQYPLPEQLQVQANHGTDGTNSANGANSRNSAESRMTSNDENNVNRSQVNEGFNQATVEIELPNHVQKITSYIVIAWSIIAALGCLATYRSARYLNRLAAFFPDADKASLKHLLNRVSERDQTRIQLKVSEQWNSPFVTPDKTICIPRWAYTKLTEDQRDAMLAHEVAHVLRNDPAWRVAMQLLSRICFFQPLHRVAVRKLEMLAELACDENAAHTSGKPQELAEALYACARVFKKSEAPSLALAMSRQGSPLLKRITSLLDQDLLAQAAIPQTRTALVSKYGILSISLLLLVFTTPNIVLSFEKVTPQLREVVASVSNFATAVKAASTAESMPIRVTVSEKDKPAILPATITHQPATFATLATPELRNINIVPVAALPSEQLVSPSDLSEANRLRAKKDFSRAVNLYQMLAEQGSVEAQQALGEIYWSGYGVKSNADIAEMWFKKASANGALNADKFLVILAERRKRQDEIHYFTNEFDGKDLKFAEMNCVRPDFGTTAHNSVDIENMINQMNEFATCFNKYGERLNASKNVERLIPNDLIRLMTDDEVEKSINRSTRALATIRLTANMIADDFTMEKRSWETRTRDYFRGARSRDWSSLKRVALINGVEPELAIMHDPQLVKIETETRVTFRMF